MAKFKVLRGLHSEGGCTYQPGDVVDSASDLSRHNRPGSRKFEKVEGDVPSSIEAVQVAAEKGFNSSEEPAVVPLEHLTLKQLKDLASEWEIDLGSSIKKDEIISTLRAEGVER